MEIEELRQAQKSEKNQTTRMTIKLRTTTNISDKDKAHTAQPNQPQGVINCISGGFTEGGASSSAHKYTYQTMLAVGSTINNHQTLPTFPKMTFQLSDFNSTELNLDNPVVIFIQMGDLIVQKVLLDPGSSADVLFYSTFQKMKLSDNILQLSTRDLVGFLGERVPVLGSVWLQTTLGESPLTKTLDVQCLVVDCFSPYNFILGRSVLNKFCAIISTIHLCVKFDV
ncbi:uncharacterized protein LOC130939745 [Arachis stenosperma]|uniref:uncharacterized protein LOC130939745 n=1 Tax=Arachis stenosperma TaxID=217475 RepID=UPI0025AB6B01|nr:uncharacterized protein LOC130939745 [Arachis stenosperma]